MNPETVPIHRRGAIQADGMLFVRTVNIVDTMVKVPLLVAGVIIVAAMMPIQSSFSSPSKALDLIIYPDGTTHVSTEIDMDPLLTDDYKLELFGSTIDNFVAVGEDDFLLLSDVDGSTALIETFGSSVLSVEYDIHDLVSKQGRIWTFSLDTPSDFTLLLPKNSAIVGMTNIPINMEIINDQNRLTLSGGNTEIDYLFSTITTPSVPITPPVDPVTPLITTPPAEPDYLVYAATAGAAIAAAGIIIGIIAITKTRQKNHGAVEENLPTRDTAPQPNTATTTVDTIFKQNPDIREDDKEIVKFIFENGGKVLESDLRKKFLQPRTTMWRAVKRLERYSIIEIEKKDMQNLVKLRQDIKEEKEEQ